MNKTRVLTVLLMMLAIPTWVFADFTDQVDRFEFGPVAGVGFYFGQKNPVENSDLLRVQSYDPIAFGEERATLRWPGIETFGFSLGYRIDTRWTVTLKAVHQRVCFAEYDTIFNQNKYEEQRAVYYNTMWHVDAMAEYNLLNLGNAMVPEQSIYNVVPYVGLGIGVTIYNQNATLRAVNRNNSSEKFSKMNTTFPMVGKMYQYSPDSIAKNPLGVGLYIPVACGVKWRINDNVQLKASFQYQLYFSNKSEGGLNSNIEGATKVTYLTQEYVGAKGADIDRFGNLQNRPGFSDLKKQIVGANHDCIFSISAIFNLSKWKEDRLILY